MPNDANLSQCPKVPPRNVKHCGRRDARDSGWFRFTQLHFYLSCWSPQSLFTQRVPASFLLLPLSALSTATPSFLCRKCLMAIYTAFLSERTELGVACCSIRRPTAK